MPRSEIASEPIFHADPHEGEVIHIIVKEVKNFTGMLQSVAQREGGQGNVADPAVHRVRNIYIPDLQLGSGIRLLTRDF